MSSEAAAKFIAARLPLVSPPGLPELCIHTAHPSSGLRRLTTRAPYWAYPWPGGVALARFVLDNPKIVAGRHVLDLGCGSGLVGIAAARAGAAAVSVFDTDPLARVATELNAAANGVALAVVPEIAFPPDGINLVLAGDVFYSAAVSRRVTAHLRRCRQAGITVLVGDPGREHLPRRSLHELARFSVAEFGGAPAIGSIYAFEP